MLTLFGYIIQLILSPKNGWEDLAQRNPDPELLLTKGLYPLMGLAAATEVLGLVYHEASLAQVLIGAINVFGTYFVTIFIARLIFDMYLDKLAGTEVDKRRASTLIVVGVAMMVTFQLIENCLPWGLLIVKFLPIYAILVLSKGTEYLGLTKRKELKFTALSGFAIVAVPLFIYYFIFIVTK